MGLVGLEVMCLAGLEVMGLVVLDQCGWWCWINRAGYNEDGGVGEDVNIDELSWR